MPLSLDGASFFGNGSLKAVERWQKRPHGGKKTSRTPILLCPLLTQGGHVGHGKRLTVKELPITTRGHSEYANWHPARPGSHLKLLLVVRRQRPSPLVAIPFSANSLMKSVSRATKASSIFRLNGGCASCSRLRTNTLH